MRSPFLGLFSALVALGAIGQAGAVPANITLHKGRLGQRQCHGKGGGQGGGPEAFTVHNYIAHGGEGGGEPTGAVRNHMAEQSPQPPAPPVDGNKDAGEGAKTTTVVRTVIVTAGKGPVTENAIATEQSSQPKPQPQPTQPQPQPQPKPQPQPNSQPKPQPAPAPTAGGGQGGGNKVSDAGRVGKVNSEDPRHLLQLHNDYRGARGKPPLTWNDTLADFATNYALDCKFDHSWVPSSMACARADMPEANTLRICGHADESSG
jgi:hypothetical protein